MSQNIQIKIHIVLLNLAFALIGLVHCGDDGVGDYFRYPTWMHQPRPQNRCNPPPRILFYLQTKKMSGFICSICFELHLVVLFRNFWTRISVYFFSTYFERWILFCWIYLFSPFLLFIDFLFVHVYFFYFYSPSACQKKRIFHCWCSTSFCSPRLIENPSHFWWSW